MTADVAQGQATFIGAPFTFSHLETNDNVVLGVTTWDAPYPVTFTISSCSSYCKYVSVNASGAVLTKYPLDAEVLQYFNIMIGVIDVSTGNVDDYALVNILIGDVNDNPPVLQKIFFTATIPEDSAVNTTIVSITCTDADVTAANRGEVFSIIGGDPMSQFKVVTPLSSTKTYTGTVYVNAPLDFGTMSQYYLVLVVRDLGGLNATAFVNVSLSQASFRCVCFYNCGIS